VTLKIIKLALPAARKVACLQDGFGVRDDGVDVVSCLSASCHRLVNQKRGWNGNRSREVKTEIVGSFWWFEKKKV
jgi:hypothetical protein